MRPKTELVRVVKSPEGVISLDASGKAPGRGAYLCPDVDCFKRSRKNRGLERAFKGGISDEIVSALEAEIVEVSDGG